MIEYKVIYCEKKLDKKNNTYYVLELREGNDRGGRVRKARLWDDVASGIPEKNLPELGQYWGQVTSRPNIFRGEEQIVILGYTVILDVEEGDQSRFEDIRVIDEDQVLEKMFHWRFWDEDMKGLMERIEGELKEEGVFDKLRDIPAGASYHHNYRGGFLLHIDEMMEFADQLCHASIYGHSMINPRRDPEKDILHVGGLDHYPGLVDYQILRAAIVLHDIGKVYDFDSETLQYQSNPMSECLEHTIIGILLVERNWDRVSAESIDRELRLKHALAAHHGAEMGAVVPKTPEAILIHHIDMISANLDVCRSAYRLAKNGIQPEYSKMLGARPFIPKSFPDSYQDRGVNINDTTIEDKAKLPWEE